VELTEPIERINNQLQDLYGIDTSTGQPMWRVAFSDDQFEHRLDDYEDKTESGIYLRTVREVRYVPKYWFKGRYVLERLVLVPYTSMLELPAVKMSYEPLHIFQTGSGHYLPPRLDACQFAIDLVHTAMGQGDMAKYKDPDSGLSKDDIIEKQRERIDNLQEELFGNETFTGDALAHHEAIVVPRNYKKES
jgi:hypothetical protein